MFTKAKVLSFEVCVLAKEEVNGNSKKHTEFLREFPRYIRAVRDTMYEYVVIFANAHFSLVGN